jgi:putative lipoprotein
MVTGGCHRSVQTPLWPSVLLSLGLWVTLLSRMQQAQPANSAQQRSTSAPSPNPQQPPSQQTNPSAVKRPAFRSVLVRHSYQCAGGVQLVAIVETNAIRITMNGNGQVYELRKAASAGSNLKYSSGPIVWSSDVQTGTLEDDSDAANPKILAKGCQLQTTAPVRLPANTISGTVNFAPMKELPPDAEIRIELLDLKPLDELHKRVGVLGVSILGRKPPIPFELRFDPQNIRSKDCCALYAELRVGGKTLFASARPHAVPDIANPGSVKLDLVLLKNAQP